MANNKNCFSPSDHSLLGMQVYWHFHCLVFKLKLDCFEKLCSNIKLKDEFSTHSTDPLTLFVLMIINVSFSFSKNYADTLLFWDYEGQRLSSLSMVIRAWATIHKYMSKKLKPSCRIMCTPWGTWCQTAMRYVRIKSIRIIFTLVERRLTANFADECVW